MRIYVLIAALLVGGCVAGNGHQPRDHGASSYDDLGAEIVRPPKEKPPRRQRPNDPDEEDCAANLTACMESRLSKEPGHVHGSNRCRQCMEVCEALGEWPLVAWGGERCDWWSHPPKKIRWIAGGSESR